LCRHPCLVDSTTDNQNGCSGIQATLLFRKSGNMLQNFRACTGLLGQLSQQLQAAAYYSVQIVVPALGDSISDGEQAVHLLQPFCCLLVGQWPAELTAAKATCMPHP
jgi:hypothetical protein